MKTYSGTLFQIFSRFIGSQILFNKQLGCIINFRTKISGTNIFLFEMVFVSSAFIPPTIYIVNTVGNSSLTC